MLTLQDFISKYKGLTGQGNTPQNMGQCVGLVSLWQDNLGAPHEYGNAKDLLNDADTALFDVIENSPTDFPVAGDIIVWGDTWGNGVGHCAIDVTADVNSFTSFEQNDATGVDPNGACEVLTHPDYSGVLGWLHFKAGYPQGGDGVDNVSKAVEFDRIVTFLNSVGLLPTNNSNDYPNDKLLSAVEALKADRDHQAGNATKWDSICSFVGLQGDSSAITVAQVEAKFGDQKATKQIAEIRVIANE